MKTQIQFSLVKKIEMIDLMRNGKSRPETCKTYGISPSTPQNFIGVEAKLPRNFEMNGNAKRCMIRNSLHFNLGHHLNGTMLCRSKGDAHWANGLGESHQDCAALQ